MFCQIRCFKLYHQKVTLREFFEEKFITMCSFTIAGYVFYVPIVVQKKLAACHHKL